MRDRRLGPASGLALAYSLALLGDQMLYVFLPSQPAAAGIAAASLGIILSANRFVRLGANPLAGLLSDRLGRRGPYLLGMVLALLSTAGYLVADGFWPLLASRLVWGVAFALIHVVGAAIMLDVSTDADRGRTIGAYQSLARLGTLVGLVLSGFLTDWLGYRGTLRIYVPLALLGIVVAMMVLRKRSTPEARPAASARPAGGLGALATLRRLDPRLLAPAYVNFTNLFATSGVVMSTLGVHLKSLSGESGAAGWLLPVASLTGVLLALRQVAAIVEAPIAGYLLDRVSDRRAITAAGVALSLAGFLVLVAGQGVVSVIAGVALISMGEGFIAPAVAVWTGEGAPPHLRGVVMGGLATAGDLGSALGPLVGYALFATSGLHAAYALGGGLILSALLVLALVPPRAPVSQGA
jgi:MFS family permease